MFTEKVWGGRRIGRIFDVKLPTKKRIGEWRVFMDRNVPVVLKVLDVKRPLSVQVHPPGENGKTELWYVLEAGKSALVLGGLALEEFKIRKGDWIYLPGGTVHTILPPAVLFEVSQDNLTTYRLYDWGRTGRPLAIYEGIKAVKAGAVPKIYRNIDFFKCHYFGIKRIRLKKNNCYNSRRENIFFVLNGAITAKGRLIKKGQAVLTAGRVCAVVQTDVFSVSWRPKNSSTMRPGIL